MSSQSTDRSSSITQEQQRVAVGPENAQFMSIRQMASDADTLRPLLQVLL